MSRDPRLEIDSAIGPLRAIFWGGLLVVIDFSFSSTTNGTGFKLDILNDTLGWILILWGVVQLRGFAVDARFASRMGIAVLFAIINLINSLREFIVTDWPEWVGIFSLLLGIGNLVAIVLFCSAMIQLAMAAGLERSPDSWRTTRILFIVIYVVPLGLFWLAALVAMATGESFNINLGPAFLLVLLLFLVPLVHLFVSTSRMRREAESRKQAVLDL
jgi:hypothetical protein